MDYPGIPIYPYYLAPLGVLRNRPRPVLKAGAPANEEAQAPPGEGPPRDPPCEGERDPPPPVHVRRGDRWNKQDG